LGEQALAAAVFKKYTPLRGQIEILERDQTRGLIAPLSIFKVTAQD